MNLDTRASFLMQRLASHWRELLKVSEVKASDHFIELGGHSLLAMTLINLIDEELGIRLQMKDIFTTLERLATVCDAKLAEQNTDAPADVVLHRDT